MICVPCGGKGIIRLNWADAPDDFALCLCAAGMDMRGTWNHDRKVPALWEVWAAREQVHPSRIFRVEDVLTADELTGRGLAVQQGDEFDRAAKLMAAGRGKR